MKNLRIQCASTKPSKGSQIRRVNDVKFIPEKYKAILLDQFGVLHNGKNPYPWSPKAVEFLAKSKVKVMIISNSSRRSKSMFQHLEKMGFDRNWFYGGVTSGDVVHEIMKTRSDANSKYNFLGNKCCYISWATRSLNNEPGQNLYDPPEILQSNIQVERNIVRADFIQASGMEAILKDVNGEITFDKFTSDQIIELIKQMPQEAIKKIPMILGNPDKVTVSGDTLLPMPGTLGEIYKSLGGKVIPMGKPGIEIYNFCCQQLNEPFQNILAVGDSFEFDIKGAEIQNIDTLLIEDGIHVEQIKAEGIEKTALSLGCPLPHYTTPKFSV